ncbi:TlpA disulfide reductase family protein [Paraburkholderia fungorum]|uniref:TlpA family protein disulfide reductase n=1 Tax=Paraburkholderia fungorum TaxID=134537 RepID=UPI003313C390
MKGINRFRLSIAKCLTILLVGLVAVTGYLALGKTKSVPDATFVLTSGQKLTTADLRGKVYLVNFWATSCATCIKEMPQMIQTYNKFKGENFDFVAISMNYDPPMYVTNYAETRRLPFRMVMDTDGNLARKFFNVQMTPTTYLVDKNGTILKQFLGEPDFAALDRMIRDALARSA